MSVGVRIWAAETVRAASHMLPSDCALRGASVASPRRPGGRAPAARRPGLLSRRCQSAAREPAQPNRSAVALRVPRGRSLLHSLIESAKLAGVEPRGYLREATLRAVRNPGAATLARDFKSSES